MAHFLNMSPVLGDKKSMLVLLNSRSGWGQANNFFHATLQRLLDATGVVYEVVPTPPAELGELLSARDPTKWDSVAVVGGDGSLNAYAFHAFHTGNEGWREKPVLIIPTGEHNSLASSLHVGTPEAAVASLHSGQQKRIPLWNVTLSGHPVTYACSSVNVGVYADVLRDARYIRQYWEEFVSLPMVRRRKFWASLYNAAYLHRTMPMTVEITPVVGEKYVVQGPLRAIVGSQARLQHTGYSLTPDATISDTDPSMAVTVADSTATRARLLHLLFREGAARQVEVEDGVSTHKAKKFEIKFDSSASRTAPSEVELHSTLERLRKGTYTEEDEETVLKDVRSRDMMALVDGELCPAHPGTTLTVEPSPLCLNVYVP